MKLPRFLLVVCLFSARAFAQGDLTPPGPPGPTMKTLDQIEPRTLLAGGTSTVTINTSGTYRLTGNIAVTSGSGIVISADDVTLDLNGFTISSSGALVNNTAGVLLTGNRTGVHVLNGHIRGTVTYSAPNFSGGSFDKGIYGAGNSLSCRMTGVSVVGVNTGISDFQNSFSVESCEAQTCRFYGFIAGVVSRSRAQDCGSNGIIARTASHCAVEGNSSSSCLQAVTATNCFAFNGGNGGGISASMAENSFGQSAGGIGLSALAALNSYGVSTSGIGLNAETATNCYGQSTSSNGIRAATATGCYGYSATNRGISCDVVTSSSGYCQSGVSFGINSAHIASFSYGYSMGGVGLASYIATSCRGQSSSGESVSATFKYNMP